MKRRNVYNIRIKTIRRTDVVYVYATISLTVHCCCSTAIIDSEETANVRGFSFFFFLLRQKIPYRFDGSEINDNGIRSGCFFIRAPANDDGVYCHMHCFASSFIFFPSPFFPSDFRRPGHDIGNAAGTTLWRSTLLSR